MLVALPWVLEVEGRVRPSSVFKDMSVTLRYRVQQELAYLEHGRVRVEVKNSVVLGLVES